MKDVKFLGTDKNNVFRTRLFELIGSNTTQIKLAEEVGISRQILSEYMGGKTKPSIEILYKIAKHFKVSADYLIGLSDSKSLDVTQKQISNIMGLSDKAIETLESFNKESISIDDFFKPIALSYLLADKEALEMIANCFIGHGEPNQSGGHFVYLVQLQQKLLQLREQAHKDIQESQGGE